MSSSEDDGAGRFTTWTLGAIKERNLALEGYCQTEGCGGFYVFDVDALISGMGADYIVPEILPGTVCKQCGGPLKFKLVWRRQKNEVQVRGFRMMSARGLDAVQLTNIGQDARVRARC